MSVLDRILERKQLEVARLRKDPGEGPLQKRAEQASAPRGFGNSLRTGPSPRVIAEFKRASPSKGVICADADPARIASAYAQAGAAALSVLTDAEFFQGSLEDLRAAREACTLPVLRKDFVIDAYQIDEAQTAGADAVLLIVAALAPDRLAALAKRAAVLGLDVLVELHDEAELEAALDADARLLGVNNRDLETFEVDLAVTERLASRLAAHGRGRDVLLVTESGIHTPEDIARLEGVGAQAFLVGESLMREPDVALALKHLRQERREP